VVQTATPLHHPLQGDRQSLLVIGRQYLQELFNLLSAYFLRLRSPLVMPTAIALPDLCDPLPIRSLHIDPSPWSWTFQRACRPIWAGNDDNNDACPAIAVRSSRRTRMRATNVLRTTRWTPTRYNLPNE
jgi:hypothetical protein